MYFFALFFFNAPLLSPFMVERGEEEAGTTSCILVPEALTAGLSGGEGALWGTSGAPGKLEWGQP